jgi:hypothetical protein
VADDITLPGTAAVVATDDIGSGRQVQLVKPVYGADGSATMVSAASPLPTALPPLVVTGSGTSISTVIAQTDVSAYTSLVLSVTGTFSATWVLEESTDGSTWITKQLAYTSGSTANAYGASFSTTTSTNFSTVGGAYGPVALKYIRLRITAYTSGTLSVVITATSAPPPVQAVYIGGIAAGSGTFSVGANSGSSANDNASALQWALNGALGYGFNGTGLDRHRLPRIFKSVTTQASGDTAVWTPASGKRWQLLRFQLFATADAAQTTGGVITVTLRDVTTSTGLAIPVYVPTTGGTALGGWSSGWIDVGPYGYRAAAINTALNVNLSAALTAGAIGVVACGTEE